MAVSRIELRGKAQTVRGPVDPAVLGAALMHEHLTWNLTGPSQRGGEAGAEPGLVNH